ncbi:MAG: hypothetical protein MI810_03535 [Flavobacteriales bacterium]|nr:hypothetical protein [Flavobacteriales bacterium]
MIDNDNTVLNPTITDEHTQTEMLDFDYIKSIGGWSFVKTITPLFLKGSRDSLRRVIFCNEENDFEGIQFGLHKLQGTANIIGALRMVRYIMSIQLLIERREKTTNFRSLLNKEIERLVDHFNDLENFLKNPD